MPAILTSRMERADITKSNVAAGQCARPFVYNVFSKTWEDLISYTIERDFVMVCSVDVITGSSTQHVLLREVCEANGKITGASEPMQADYLYNGLGTMMII